MATGTPMQQETYLPDGAEQVKELFEFLEAHEKASPEAKKPYYVLGGTGTADRVELPPEIYRVLRKVVDALQQGLAVTIVPSTQTLTTQEAADLLGVSRPTVVKLLDEGKIPFERTNTHRRVLLKELLAYRERRRAAQYAALDATAVGIDDEDDLSVVLEQLREARHAVARRRRNRAPS